MALMTVADLAARWKRRESWVRQQAKAKTIPAVRIGHFWRFDPAEIERYEQRHATRDPLSMTDLSAKRRSSRKTA